MKTIIKILTKQDTEEIQAWENFLLENNTGTILQSSLMGEVFRGCGFDWTLVVAKQNGVIVGGALSTVWPSNKFRFLKKFSTFKTTYGPIVGTKEAKTKIAIVLLKKIEEIISEWGAIKHIILTKDEYLKRDLELLDYKINSYVVSCTFLMDLHKSEDELWKNLRKTMRPSLNKAKRFGVEIKEINDETAPLIMHHLHVENYKRVNLSPNPLSFHKSMWEILAKKNRAKFFFAFHKGTPVAGLVILMDRRGLYAYSGGSLSNARKVEANKFLHWSIILWGIKHGYDYYDFLFAPSGKYRDNPAWGIYIFKKDYGGLELPVFYYEKKFSKIRLRFWEKILVPVYNLIGRGL